MRRNATVAGIDALCSRSLATIEKFPQTTARRQIGSRTHWSFVILAVLCAGGCAFDKFTPPPVSPALIAGGGHIHADGPTLQHGYAIFVSKCLDCHTLPPTTRYSKDEWPYLVNRMANRAGLSRSDEAALIAYLRAASTPAP